LQQRLKILKGTTSRKLFVQFPELKQKLSGGHLWSPSYYAGTAGNVSAEKIKKYSEQAEHIGEDDNATHSVDEAPIKSRPS
jgi:putative transposase